MNKITPVDSGHLAVLERVIESGKRTFVSVGLALEEIRQEKLYREQYSTFEEYCQKRWGWSAQRGRQLINSAAVIQALPKETVTIVTTEGAARAIAKVAPEKRVDVINEASKSGTVTAASITQAASQISTAAAEKIAEKAKKCETVFDRTGLPIPRECIDLWNRCAEVQKFLTQLSEMRGTLRKAQEDNDFLWGGLNYSGALADLGRTYTSIECAKPYAVCPKCQGRLANNCVCCKGRGMVSQYLWDSTTTREEKAIRAKVVEQLQSK